MGAGGGEHGRQWGGRECTVGNRHGVGRTEQTLLGARAGDRLSGLQHPVWGVLGNLWSGLGHDTPAQASPVEFLV